jgi:predicted ribosomally synthesized peptide with SipW-like signal peptide
MRRFRLMKAAGLVLAAVLLGLLAVQGSYALWNQAASANAGTVQAADFRVSLTDTQTSNTTNMTLSDGTAAAIALTTSPAGAVVPGLATYAGVQLGNVTNAGGPFTIRAAIGSTPTVSDAGSGLASYLTVKAVAATSLDQCSSAALYTSALVTDLPNMTIAKGGTGVFCFQVALSAAIPAALAGSAAGVTIPIVVTQQ